MLMVLNKEPASIQLFGKTISISLDISGSDIDDRSSSAVHDDLTLATGATGPDFDDGDESSERQPAAGFKQELGTSSSNDPTTPSCASEHPETQSLSSNGQENETGEIDCQVDQNVLKKPDKKVPCPRCDSANTKFCYYNNYNTNQPRHFCRGCQRYWTAGGTMRNVPVGSGRRRTKSSSPSQCLPSVVFGASQVPDYRNYGTILNFGSGFPVLNLVERAKDCLQNGVQPHGIDHGDDCSSVSSSVTASSSSEKRMDSQRFQSGVSVFPAAYSRLPVSLYSTQSDLDNTTLTLGKHARDGKPMKHYLGSIGESEEMRFKDGSNSEKVRARHPEFTSSKGHFTAFRPYASGIAHIPEMSSVLQANPAAMSRSLNFHETS